MGNECIRKNKETMEANGRHSLRVKIQIIFYDSLILVKNEIKLS